LIVALQYKLFKSDSYALRKMAHKIIKQIPKMDVFLSIGGDSYCYGEQPERYEVNRNIKKAGKKLVLWGCSIGEEDTTPNNLLDLKSFDLIIARESLTYTMLRNKGLTNVKLCADGAFLLEKEELPLPKEWEEGNTIGINYSPLVYSKNKNSLEAIQKLIDHILETTSMTIAFTPHVTEENNNDYIILSQLFEQYKHTNRVLLLPDDLNAIQYKGYIARMRFFIGARTHATIAAYSNCVPTMVLGYSVKSKGIAKDIFGEEKLVLSIDELSDSEKLISKFEEMKSEEVALKKELQQVIPEIKVLAQEAGKILASLLKE
jgi:polysaccharide pyruvyl transferase WcaK-like protein